MGLLVIIAAVLLLITPWLLRKVTPRLDEFRALRFERTQTYSLYNTLEWHSRVLWTAFTSGAVLTLLISCIIFFGLQALWIGLMMSSSTQDGSGIILLIIPFFAGYLAYKVGLFALATGVLYSWLWIVISPACARITGALLILSTIWLTLGPDLHAYAQHFLHH